MEKSIDIMTPKGLKTYNPKGLRTIESIAMKTLKKGQSFFTSKPDKDMTAISSQNKRKIRTERVFVLNPQTGVLEKAVKVTLR
jgi:hypothetical protein